MKIVTETELEGSEVVEVVARALFAHVTCPGGDPETVAWPPKNKSTLMAYWNKARAVVKAQHAYVSKREAAEAKDRSAILEEHELMRKTLQTIAADTADGLQHTQAIGALANIGPRA